MYHGRSQRGQKGLRRPVTLGRNPRPHSPGFVGVFFGSWRLLKSCGTVSKTVHFPTAPGCKACFSYGGEGGGVGAEITFFGQALLFVLPLRQGGGDQAQKAGTHSPPPQMSTVTTQYPTIRNATSPDTSIIRCKHLEFKQRHLNISHLRP